MKEYIEREKLNDDILHALLVVPNEDFLLPPEKDIVRTIKSEPAADVRPVVRGKWTDKRTIEHDGEWYCTACGKEITIYMGADRKDRYAYFPNCGADMREES